MAEKTVEVTVTAPFQVVLEGVAYGPGETFNAPPAAATLWITYGWVSLTD